MKKPPVSWLALITFCVLTTFLTALGFGFLFVGGSVVFAVAQAPHVSDDTKPVIAAKTDAAASQASQLSTAKVNSAPSGRIFSGMITDSRCGARHPMNSGKTSAECARACAREGSIYVLVDGEVVRALEGDPYLLGRLAGERVEIVGMLEGNTIRVESVASR
jgi:membrane protein implicated in regulation of membrane protease activity